MYRTLNRTRLVVLLALLASVVIFSASSPANRSVWAARGGTKTERKNEVPGQPRRIDAVYKGDPWAAQALAAGVAIPRALAATDLDRNGTPDLVTGYSYNGMGIVTTQRGNPDAYAPKDESVFERMQNGYNPDPLLPAAYAYAVPEGVDLLQVGDFNHDNRNDALVAARGGDMFLLAGDDVGGFASPERIQLSGTVTAMTAGEFRAADGWTDAAVGIMSAEGPELLVFDGIDGVTGDPIYFHLSAQATGLQIDGLDNDPYRDIAVVASNELDVIHGWGRKQVVDPGTRIERIVLAYTARDIATGFFVWSRAADSEIAILSEDGVIHIMARGGIDERAFTEAEMQTRARSRGHLVKQNIDIESLAAWQPGTRPDWDEVRHYRTGDAVVSDDREVFQRSHFSFGETDDLLTLDHRGKKMTIVGQTDKESDRNYGSNDLVAKDIELGSVPASALILPQELNGERSLIFLSAGTSGPSEIVLAPTATITVDRFDDPNGGALAAASVCGAGGSDCSLRGAVQFANANAGTTINIPAGTVVLATNGVGGNGGCTSGGETNANGDLEINPTTTVAGAGSASTIIRQAAATNDRVICLDVPLAANTYLFSGMTITGGRDQGINGGAGLLGGAKNAVTNFTDVTFVNNQTSNASFGGGGATVTGGNMTVTNCTFGAANLPGPPGNRNDLTVGNASFTSGGGLAYTSGDPAGTGGAVGTLTVTGTTFTHNTAAGIGGGGLDVFGLNLSTPTVNVSTTSFSSNQGIAAATSGGGMINEAANVTVATTSFTSNSVLNRGGGLYVGGGTTLLDGTNPSLTFSSNTAPNNPSSSSISTASALNVSGTNTTIGGSIEITLGGIWTTNAGTNVNPTDILIAGGTMNCNNSTMNITGNLTLGPSGNGLVGGTFNGNTGTVNLSGNLTTNTGGSGPAPSFTGGTNFNFVGSGAQSSGGTLSPTFTNLTVNKTNTLTLGVNSSVTGNLTVTAGTFDLGAFTVNRNVGGGTLTVNSGTTLKIGGTNPLPSNYSTHSIGATSTIEYSGTNQTVSTLNSSQNYGNLTVSGSGTKTLQGATTVVADLTINGGTLDVSASNFALNLAGNFTNNVAAANFNPRAGTVTFNGSGAQNINGTATSDAFNNFTVNKGGGTLTVGGSTTALTIGGATTLTAGTFAAGTAATITMSGGNWTNNGGTFTPGSGTVSFTNTAAAQAINGSAASQTFNNITVAKTAQTLSVGGSTTALTLNGTMLLTSGTLSAGTAANINVAGNWTNNGGTFTSGTGAVTFNGGAAQSVNGTAATQTFNNYGVNKGGGTLTVGGSTTTLNVNTTTLTAGTFAAGTATAINSSGDWTNNGGTFTPGTGTVNLNNTAGAQALNGSNASQTFNNVTVAKTAQTLSGGGTLSTLTLNGALTLTSGTFSVGTITNLNIAGNWTNNGGTFTPGSSNVTFNSTTAAQSINGSAASQTFNSLTVNKTGQTLSGAGSTTTLTLNGDFGITAGTFAAGTITTMNVAGNWANTGTFTPGASNTVVLNGNNNTQALTGTTSFNNLTSNHTGTGGVTASGSSLTATGLFRIQGGTFTSSSSFNNVQIDSGTTLASDGSLMNVTGNWTNNGGTFTPNGNTVSFNGGAAQVIGGSSTTQTFNNFTVNKSGNALTTTATTLGVNNLTMTTGNFTAPATQNVGGNVLLTAGNFTAGANTNVAGNWTNNGGTFTPGANTVTLNGASAETIGGSGANTFGSLTINNAAGVTLSGNTTVNNLLTMTNGNIDAGVNTLIIAATTGSVNHTAGVVLGKVQKNIAAGARSPESPQAVFTYPVGTLTGYSPVTANFTAGSNGSLTVAAFDGTMPAVPAISDATALDRYWQMTKVNTVTADLTLQYLAADVDGTEANYRLIRGSGGIAIALANGCPTSPCVNAATHTITANGVTQFDNFWTAGEPLAPTAANVEVAGRVLTADGRGVFGARVQMTDSSGNIRTALTSSLGYYRFDNVPSGQDYVIQVAHKRYVFAPRLVSVSDALGDVDFVAEP